MRMRCHGNPPVDKRRIKSVASFLVHRSYRKCSSLRVLNRESSDIASLCRLLCTYRRDREVLLIQKKYIYFQTAQRQSPCICAGYMCRSQGYPPPLRHIRYLPLQQVRLYPVSAAVAGSFLNVSLSCRRPLRRRFRYPIRYRNSMLREG